MNHKNNEIFFQNMDESDFLPLIPMNEMGDDKELLDIPEEIILLPLRNTVLFPGVVIPITVGRDKSIAAVTEAYKGGRLIGVLAQKDDQVEEPTAEDLCKVGTVAKIIKLIRMPDGGTTIIIQGKKRFDLKEVTQVEPFFKAKIELYPVQKEPEEQNFLAHVDSIKDLASQIIQLSPNMPTEASIILRNIESPEFLINFVAGNMNVPIRDKQQLLEINSVEERSVLLISLLQKQLQFAELKNKVTNNARTEIDKQQREYFLQQQLKSIKDELGGENDMEISSMKKRAETKKWPEAAKELFNANISKLERMHSSTPDYSVLYNHTDFLLNLPWDEYSQDNYDLNFAEDVLNKDHYGVKKIKERILEYLAVLKLKGDMKSPILCFVGPPGIGKTSLGKSIAAAIGRKYIRLSLGGLHDESEIRGHRKTYIGAMPGRILQNIKKAKTSNPVIILDEIDKVGGDHRGDPSSALLEVLDPEQNATFYDNYLELEYDLSRVLFIATANDLASIQPALRDRLEIINLNGYAIEEKVEIAKKYLIPKQKEAHGLEKTKFRVAPKVIERVIEKYTRESGVRELDRQIASIMRYIARLVASGSEVPKAVTEDLVTEILGKTRYSNELYRIAAVSGVAVGLAWTSVGGDILFIEALLSPGKGELRLTGNLGDVMKESAMTALSYAKAHAKQLGIDPAKFQEYNIHIHVPEGAVPKDGPSAGITMLSAITSAFTGRKVKPYLGMTGEITLRGQVLPVGGIKEKVLAAKRAGLKELILCDENEKDVLEIEPAFIKGVKFHYVNTMMDVLKLALTK